MDAVRVGVGVGAAVRGGPHLSFFCYFFFFVFVFAFVPVGHLGGVFRIRRQPLRHLAP